ncbi:hypothetical protein [Dyella agri]|uniref:Uncharacterized protein n=1 Tax=Dyella agri TaxID=1926869 RepID=A0ABW8KI13_9GAMM
MATVKNSLVRHQLLIGAVRADARAWRKADPTKALVIDFYAFAADFVHSP